ncbi:right-handed parallel beta-helix repeat-containing protein [Micromonospora thermarum]|uniref:Right-handed parallel beta-helix repeat-containing protein n=1 Tax=Micromonospora thermarum TaxID=2720024 RepID=A0ABX0Z8P3_9ACTN|nr:right-handed parallel beta-helix repeat-containing protein [Micromonospora thermarum]NJP33344.1 right-handed parallel beta-helix repeat-containing protein [Micromonospora thermarum]
MVALSASLAAAVTPASPANASTWQARTYHVDCVAGNDSADGTKPTTAWRTLARVNKATFGPGDSILFLRGTTCQGVLEPKGSGTAAAPIKVGAYGTGVRPKIVAPGTRAAVFLRNVQGWEIRDLEVTNPGPVDGTARVGIYVLLENFGTGKHYVVENVYVHDVPGCDCLDPALENSGGVLFEATGDSVPTTFDGIRVTDSVVSGVDNVGIGTLSSWSKRDMFPAGRNHFMPMTNVKFLRNTLSNLGGDGILVMNGVDSRTARNKIDGFGLRAAQSHAAILAYNSDRPVLEHNEITGGAAFPPSFSLTVDAGTKDPLYQYNYSHDNNGPFILFCASSGSYADGAVIRYNISDNDKDVNLDGFIIPVVAAGCDNGITNSKFYNNTIYAPNAENLAGAFPHTSIAFTNNIFSGKATGARIDDPVGVYDHNLYQNVTAVAVNTTNAVNADPLFRNPTTDRPAGFRLRCGSPAIDAGVAVPDNGGRDFWGNEVTGTTPNIGAYEGPCL